MPATVFMLTISLLGQAPEADAKLDTSRITAKQYRKYVEFLASDKLKGRRVDTPELILAAEYILQHWKKNGVQPGNQGKYLQAFEWKGRWG